MSKYSLKQAFTHQLQPGVPYRRDMTNLKQRGYDSSGAHGHTRSKVLTSKLAPKTQSSYGKEPVFPKRSKVTSKTRAVKTSMKEIESDDGDMSPINSDQEFNPSNLPAEESTPQHVNTEHLKLLEEAARDVSGNTSESNPLYGEMVRRNIQTPQMKTLSIHSINSNIRKN